MFEWIDRWPLWLRLLVSAAGTVIAVVHVRYGVNVGWSDYGYPIFFGMWLLSNVSDFVGWVRRRPSRDQPTGR